jgi:para-nitrobenzyl esterase
VTARDLFVADAERAIDVYRAARPHASRYDLQVAMESDRLRIPSIHIAERIRRAGGVAYMFRFDFTSPLFDRRYAPHYIEVPFVFDQIDGDLGLKLHGDRDDAQPLADAISRAWAAFARSGDPNHDGLPEWPAYDEQRRATMLLDVECGVVDDPAGDERAVWPEYVKVF